MSQVIDTQIVSLHLIKENGSTTNSFFNHFSSLFLFSLSMVRFYKAAIKIVKVRYLGQRVNKIAKTLVVFCVQ